LQRKEGSVEAISYTPIGIVRTPHTAIAGMPVQNVGAVDVRGTIEIAPEYAAGLQDLEGFSHLILLCHLHQMQGYDLVVHSFIEGPDGPLRGLFATRSPKRPNPIGLTVVRLLAVDGATLTISGVDMLDGTPLLDIKPYVPAFDARDAERTGWYAAVIERAANIRADERFSR
jgi:tRNA-Thr(GGU) m(6)t(6)A37 methyltransferase TsaA